MEEMQLVDARLDAVRSLFFNAGTNEDVLAAALASDADAVAADWEDLVPPGNKDAARDATRRLFAESAGGPLRGVRINGPDTPHFAGDLAAIAEVRPDFVIVPKATPDALAAVDVGGRPLIALVETGLGVRLAFESASSPRVRRLMIAPGDLSKDLRIEIRPDGQSVHYTRSKVVVDCAAAGIAAPLDISSTLTGDALTELCSWSRSMGFRGRMTFSLDQVASINEAYTG